MIYVEYNTDNYNKLDDLMIIGREKRRSKIYKSFVERIVGVREFHRVGPEFLKAIEFKKCY